MTNLPSKNESTELQRGEAYAAFLAALDASDIPVSMATAFQSGWDACMRRRLPAADQTYQQLMAFFRKYAIGDKFLPSCLVCGHECGAPAISHAELPGIVVCHACRDGARRAAEWRALVVELLPLAQHGEYAEGDAPAVTRASAALSGSETPTEPSALDFVTPLRLATMFHEEYESRAASFGYATREDTRTFDPDSRNGKLMINTCLAILQQLCGVETELGTGELPADQQYIELNLSNYDQSDVEQLNDWGVWAYGELKRLNCELRLTKGARDYANDMLDRSRAGLPLETAVCPHTDAALIAGTQCMACEKVWVSTRREIPGLRVGKDIKP